MALAASDFTIKDRQMIGPSCKMVVAEWTGPASYAAGGEILTHAIAKAALGLRGIHSIAFQPLVDNDGAAGVVGVNVAFDYTPTSTTHGKIRAFSSGQAAHTHSFLVKGGQAAAGTDAISIKAPVTPVIIGKEAVTDATNLGGATNGGVQSSTVTETAGDVATATNLSAFKARVVVFGF